MQRSMYGNSRSPDAGFGSPDARGGGGGILSPGGGQPGSVKKPPMPRRRRGQSTSPVPPSFSRTPVESSQSMMSPQPKMQVQALPLLSATTTTTTVAMPHSTSNSTNQLDNWVMVFGYPPVDLDRGVNVILQDFLRYGDIEEHDYKVGNYLFIRYRRSQEADAALTRNGRPLPNDPESIIGVQRVTSDLLRELGRPLQNGVIQAPSKDSRAAGAYSSVRRYNSDINLAPQARQTNICSRLIELIFSY